MPFFHSHVKGNSAPCPQPLSQPALPKAPVLIPGSAPVMSAIPPQLPYETAPLLLHTDLKCLLFVPLDACVCVQGVQRSTQQWWFCRKNVRASPTLSVLLYLCVDTWGGCPLDLLYWLWCVFWPHQLASFASQPCPPFPHLIAGRHLHPLSFLV